MKNNIEINNIIVFLFVVLVTLGQLELLISLKITNVIHIILLSFLITQALINLNKIKGKSAFLILTLVLAFPIVLFPVGNDIFGDVSRISWFLTIALIAIHAMSHPEIYREKTNSILNYYLVIGLIVIIDAIIYLFSGQTLLFPIQIYITHRFSGPFNDPNFLGFIFGVIFITAYYINKSYNNRNKLLPICILCILLSGSVSVILFTAISVLLPKVIKIKYPVIKVALTLFVTFILLPFIVNFQQEIFNVISYVSMNIFDLSSSSSDAKFFSFIYRLEAVHEAVLYFTDNPLGYGYHTLLKYLPRDTHNSYIGMAFEYGLYPLIITFIIFSFKSLSKISDSLTYFICFMALMLNIHYSPVFILATIFAIIYKDRSQS